MRSGSDQHAGAMRRAGGPYADGMVDDKDKITRVHFWARVAMV